MGSGSSSHPSTALRVLRKVVAAGVDLDEIAQEIVVSRAALDAYLAGSVPIPLDRQLCLALFIIEHVPTLARLGHQLHGQASAAIAFHGHVTETHRDPPPMRF